MCVDYLLTLFPVRLLLSLQYTAWPIFQRSDVSRWWLHLAYGCESVTTFGRMTVSGIRWRRRRQCFDVTTARKHGISCAAELAGLDTLATAVRLHCTASPGVSTLDVELSLFFRALSPIHHKHVLPVV